VAAWPQWGTRGGRVFEARNRAEQILANAINWPAKVRWFPSQAAADAYAKQQDPAAYQAWQNVQNSPGFKQAIGGAQHALDAGSSAVSGGWVVGLAGTTGLLGRALKVGFGAVLIIAGVMRFSGADKDLIQIAGSAMKVAK